MRFISAQIHALFTDGLGLGLAQHANQMAALLRQTLEEKIAAGEISGLSFTQPTQVNGVFAVMPNDAADRLRQTVRFYDWDRDAGEVRWMCSYDTTTEDIDWFVDQIHAVLPGR
jgi:threonine aldolase